MHAAQTSRTISAAKGPGLALKSRPKGRQTYCQTCSRCPARSRRYCPGARGFQAWRPL